MIALGQRYSYEEICLSLRTLADCYGEFSLCRRAGESQDGRPVFLYRLGFGRKSLVVSAGIHGREGVNPVLLLRMIEDYSQAFRFRRKISGRDVSGLLKAYSILFIPLVNPDGYEIARSGFSAVANPFYRRMAREQQISHEEWKYNARCVDINRNFPCRSYVQRRLWEYPGSEPETQTMMRVFRDYDTIGYLDFHSRGKVLYYYRGAMSRTYNQRCRRYARKLQALCGYSLGRPGHELAYGKQGGNSVQYYSERTGNPAITVETLSESASFPPEIWGQEEAYREVRALPLAFLEALSA